MSVSRTVLVLGGVRSGKSAYAVARATAAGGQVAFVATAESRDPEMADRIARHRADRPPHWIAVEAPLALAEAVIALGAGPDVAIVDCLNLWVANLLEQRADLTEDAVSAECAKLTAALGQRTFQAILVSNEVGLGVHPETPLGRRFRDALGLVNQTVARAAGEVILMVAGCPLWLKRDE